MNRIYEVPEDIAANEMGTPALQRVRQLCDWLYARGETSADPALKLRIAPSIITRSEAELFALSSPRFAIRAKLANGSFLNLRRLERFAKIAAEAHGSRFAAVIGKLFRRPHRLSHRKIRELVVNPGVCIADSLLRLPVDLEREGYFVLDCELGRAYGEGVSAAGSDDVDGVVGTPFLQHVELGGGMCAQACCFMVLALYERLVNRISGIAEITALARDYTREELSGQQLELGGLRCSQIATFFRQPEIGLWAQREFAGNHRAYAEKALHSYVMSGIPMILPVDSGRMWGDLPKSFIASSLIKKNGIPLRRRAPMKTRRQDHAVVIVGCHKTDAREYLLNDPATFPFLRASFNDLMIIRRYAQGADLEMIEDASQQDLEVIPIAPSAVKMPLLDVKIHLHKGVPSEVWGRGLLSLAKAPQTSPWSYRIRDAVLPNYVLTDFPGILRLVRLSDDNAELGQQLSFLPADAVDEIDKLVHTRTVPCRWYWIQLFSCSDRSGMTTSSVFIWNAEKSPIVAKYADSFLTAVIACDAESDNWKCILDGPADDSALASDAGSRPAIPKAEVPEANSRELQPALMSSFQTVGATCWMYPLAPYQVEFHRLDTPPTKIACELYLMMDKEVVDGWMKRFRRGKNGLRSAFWHRKKPMTAVQFLASLNPKEIELIANRTSENFRRCDSDVIAVASFVPEISRRVNTRHARIGVRAVKALIAFSRKLQQLGHNTRVVELVTGSWIQGIRRFPSGESPLHDDSYRADLASDAKSNENFLTNLTKAVSESPSDDLTPTIALELEPGPYFLLRDWPSILQLTRELQKREQLAPYVGFNLDIAHWRLADIDLEILKEVDEVRDRIVHAHIAGHHRCAHFGDIPLFDLNDPSEFVPWFELLRQIAHESRHQRLPNLPKFSGYVSLELEAAGEDEAVRRGFRQLNCLI